MGENEQSRRESEADLIEILWGVLMGEIERDFSKERERELSRAPEIKTREHPRTIWIDLV